MTDSPLTPFVILGAGRSGTTYLHSVLARHSSVSITNEAKLVDVLAAANLFTRIPAHQVYEGQIGVVNPEYIESFPPIFIRHVRAAMEEFHRSLHPDRQITHWGDKTLTVRWPESLVAVFPDMKLIVQVRDARDAVCSARSWNARPEVREHSVVADSMTIESMAQNWADVYERLAPYLGSAHVVHYEDLMTTPHQVMRGVLDFLDLKVEEGCVEELEKRHDFKSHGTTSHPSASMGRWKDDLAPDELELVEKLCGKMMKRFGYEPS